MTHPVMRESEFFLGNFGDLRVNQTGATLASRVVDRKTLIVHKLSDNRTEQVRFQRLLWSKRVTVEKMKAQERERVSALVNDAEHIIAIQDSSEFSFDHRRDEVEGLGPVKNNKSIGLFAHPVIAVDARDNFVLGLVGLKLWTWDSSRKKKSNYERDKTPIELKESYRWIETAQEAKGALTKAKKVTFISDRESDIYELFARIPDAKTHLIVRSKLQRSVLLPDGEGTQALREFIKRVPISGKRTITLEKQSESKSPKQKSLHEKLGSRTGGRSGRTVELKIGFQAITMVRPKNLPDTTPSHIRVNLVTAHEVEEKKRSANGEKKVSWALLTTHPIRSLEDALAIIDLYRKRWFVEQYFRLAKKGGLQFEKIDAVKGEVIKKLMTIGFLATVKILQLTLCREGSPERPASAIFSAEEIEVLGTVGRKFEGKTQLQKNPHKPKTVAWCHWILGRMGGWKGYPSEGPAGPYSLKCGLDRFDRVLDGVRLARDLCIR